MLLQVVPNVLSHLLQLAPVDTFGLCAMARRMAENCSMIQASSPARMGTTSQMVSSSAVSETMRR